MIKAAGLTKTFRSRSGPVEAVRGVDLVVERDEIVGFLGPNGAGKTTTQRMLTTLLEPTAGEAQVAGHDLIREPVQVRRAIGYVAQGGSALPEARVGDELVDHARLYGISRGDATARAKQLLVRLDLEGTWDRPVGSLSGGQRRRLDIALGLINTPSLLFLDEPTTGLDPQARVNLWDHIDSLRTGGATVFLTTHYLEEADSLCDRVMVIDAGRIIAEGTPASLKQSLGGETARLALRDPSDRTLVERTLRGHPLVSGLRVDDGVASLRLSTDSGELPALFDALRAAGVAVAGVEVHRPTLEDVFLSLTGRALRDEPPAAQEAHANAL